MTKSNGTKLINAIAAREHANDTKLGTPSTDPMHAARRRTIMEQMAGGKGWRTAPKEPKQRANGLTRGEMKRIRRQVANEHVSEVRAPQFMHSAARRRFEAEMAVAA